MPHAKPFVDLYLSEILIQMTLSQQGQNAVFRQNLVEKLWQKKYFPTIPVIAPVSDPARAAPRRWRDRASAHANRIFYILV